MSQHKALVKDQLDKNPFTPEAQLIAGYNPDDGYPIDHVPYEVPAGAKKLVIDVPDHMIDRYDKENHRLEQNFLSHPLVASKIIMFAPDDAQRQELAHADKNTFLFLRGQQTGRVWLAAKPQDIHEKMPWNHYYDPIYKAAIKRFNDSGMTPPATKDLVPIAVEALEPVPSKTIDTSLQTVQVPDWDKFVATVSPVLGNRGRGAPKLTGFVIKKDSEIVPESGPVRLLGMVKDPHKGQTESGWEVSTMIKKDGVRTRTLKDVIALTTVGSAQQKVAVGLVNTGHEQMKVAAKQGENLVEALGKALLDGLITEPQAQAVGMKDLESLQKLMEKESFTPRDADHYGYASLDGMKKEITAMFVDRKLPKNSPDNLIHFVDIEPVDEAKMSWFKSGRPMVRVVEDVAPSVKKGPEKAWENAIGDRGKAVRE